VIVTDVSLNCLAELVIVLKFSSSGIILDTLLYFDCFISYASNYSRTLLVDIDLQLSEYSIDVASFFVDHFNTVLSKPMQLSLH
jgi:hypothetical protein